MTMTSTRTTLELPPAVARFVRGLETGDWNGMEDALTPDVRYDASVPEWHYQYEGAARVAQDYREEWSGRWVWELVEQHASRTTDGLVLDIEVHGRPHGSSSDSPAAVVCRLANIFRLDGDRIAEHRFYCCGEWGPEAVRHIREHAPQFEGRAS